MLVSDTIAYALRIAGILGVGQTALPQDTSDGQTALMMMLKQWRQKRWLVFRLDTATFPLVPGQQTYTIGPAANNPDIVVAGNYRPANIQSCYLRQNVAGAPAAYPIDFPMKILRSRQEWDRIRLKGLGSWPDCIYYDPQLAAGVLMIWPIPIQTFFELYIAFQQAIDLGGESGLAVDLEQYMPAEAEEAVTYNLAARFLVNYKMPADPGIIGAAKAALNTLRQTNYALQPLSMPSALWSTGVRVKNPMGGFYYPETSVGVPVTVLQ